MQGRVKVGLLRPSIEGAESTPRRRSRKRKRNVFPTRRGCRARLHVGFDG